MFEGFTLQHATVLLQSVTALSIAGGFIFAAVQFRHARRAARVANFTKLVELQMQLRRMRVDDPTLAEVYRHDVSGLESPAAVRAYFFNLMQLSLFEIAWYSHAHGQLSEEYWRSWCTRMRSILQEESFRAMMNKPSMKILHDEFQELVQRMLREIPGPPAGA